LFDRKDPQNGRIFSPSKGRSRHDAWTGTGSAISGLVPKGGDSQTLLFHAAFRVFFDFPQYSDTLRHRTIHTVRTNRIIL
jgi:hypothetical protein